MVSAGTSLFLFIYLFLPVNGEENGVINAVEHDSIKSVCDLPLAVGDCKFNITRYYYDKNTNHCYKFIYKGCKGNGNRFISDKQCRQRCKSRDGQKQYTNALKKLINSGISVSNLTCDNCHTISGICIDGKCQCRMGYQLVNFKCVDVDECLWTQCGTNAVCVNSLGSYRCECALGYAGSGLNCSRDRPICGQTFDDRYEESCNNTEPLWQQRYFYNYTGGFCQQFRYGGCQFEGSQNIFRDIQACQSHCQGFRRGGVLDGKGNDEDQSTTPANSALVPALCFDKFDQSRRYPCTEGSWKARYYFDNRSRRCIMFWFDESCDKRPQHSNSRNIFVHLRTCEQVCERVAGQQLEAQNQGIAGVIQAVFDKDWNHAKILYDRLSSSTTTTTAPTTTTARVTTTAAADPLTLTPAIDDNSINLFPDEYLLATPQALPQQIPTITGNEVRIEDGSSNFIDHQYISDFERNSILTAKAKAGSTLDPATNFSLVAKLPVTVAEECLDVFDTTLTKSCDIVPNWRERYFYDPDLRACRMYWYGGCWSHSRNNFGDMTSCKWKCEGRHNKPESRDCLEKFDETYTRDCRNGMFEIRHYFNHNSKKCHSFYFGGCHSDSRNFFADVGECQATCEAVPTDISTFCSHAFDPKYRESCAVDGSWSQYYYYDKLTDSCRMFWYGNCKAESQNIFATLETCQWLCERKRENKIPSHCLDKFDEKYRDPCNGGKWSERHYFDHTTGQCKPFWYDGCISSSQNIFSNSELCRTLCEVPSLTTETPIENLTQQQLDQESVRCLEPLAVGDCKDHLPAYFYNSVSRRCEPFSYSGCHGNGNRFLTLSQCETTCQKYYHLADAESHCFLPLSIGFGRRKKTCIRHAGYYFYYNSKEAKCGRFWYLGCGGNPNKYKSKTECEQICRRSREKPVAPAKTVSVSACFEAIDKGKCQNTEEQLSLQRWGYASGQCTKFQYSGCGGTNNKFASQRECDSLCKGLKQPNSRQCAHHPDWGPCNRLRYMWFYNLTSGVCQQFLYGGCGGNENRFSTFELCQVTCEVPGEDPCSDRLDRGKWCESMSNRYYYHAKSKTCKGFHYTGCGQSRNNFHHLDVCEDVCVRRSKSYSQSMTEANVTSQMPIDESIPKTSVGVKYVGQKPAEKQPMQMHTILSETSSHYFKTEGQYVEYGHCLGFRYNISGEYTKLNSYICLMEEGGRCQVETLDNTHGEELCRVIRPWLRGSHYYSWFFTIERKKSPWRITAEELEANQRQNKSRNVSKPQQAADTVASLMILPLNDCYNVC